MKNKKDFRTMNCTGCQCENMCCSAQRCDICYRAEYAEENFEDCYFKGNGEHECSEKQDI